MRARTRVNTRVDRHLFVGPASMTHARGNAREEASCGRRRDAAGPAAAAAAVEGAFHLVAFTQEVTDVNALVFIASGGGGTYARVRACARAF